MNSDTFLKRNGDTLRIGRDTPVPTTPGGGATAARVNLTDTSQQTLVAAPTGGQSIYVYHLAGSNEGGSLTRIDVKEASTVRWSFALAASGGGFAQPLARAWKLPANTALTVQQSAAVSSYVTVIYEVE
jgi:hypothetical protein